MLRITLALHHPPTRHVQVAATYYIEDCAKVGVDSGASDAAGVSGGGGGVVESSEELGQNCRPEEVPLGEKQHDPEKLRALTDLFRCVCLPSATVR